LLLLFYFERARFTRDKFLNKEFGAGNGALIHADVDIAYSYSVNDIEAK
jgi:hypothetical protein